MIILNIFDSSASPLLLLFSTGLLALHLSIQTLLDPLRSIPGPLLARFTRLWYLLAIYNGDFERVNVELHRRYGPVVRIAPGEYSVDDVEAAKAIYGHGNAFVKAPWYWPWNPPDPNRAGLFSDINPHRHAIQRRKFSSLYSMSSLVGYEPPVDNCTAMLTQRFSELARAGKVVNLQHWLQCYAFDVIGEITFGNRFGFLDMGEDKEGVFKAIEGRSSYSTFVGVFPWLHKILFPMLPKTGGHVYVLNYASRQIEQRQKILKDPKTAGREGPLDFMTKILLAHEEDPERITRMDLLTLCVSNIGAGSDTTAITLSAILYHLLKYPQTYRRLQEELDDAEKEGRISDPVTFKQAQELPYLQAVIREGLRIHPATGLPMQRIVPSAGATIAGRSLPSGSTVGINAWVAHRNEKVFGGDAGIWRPERWLEMEEQGRGGEVEKYSLAFGMGSRTCIGKNISLLEMSKLVPQLVRNFNFELDEQLKTGGLVCENRWFVKQLNFKGRVVARDRR